MISIHAFSATYDCQAGKTCKAAPHRHSNSRTDTRQHGRYVIGAATVQQRCNVLNAQVDDYLQRCADRATDITSELVAAQRKPLTLNHYYMVR
jgi:hypothetical protein